MPLDINVIYVHTLRVWVFNGLIFFWQSLSLVHTLFTHSKDYDRVSKINQRYQRQWGGGDWAG